MLAITPETFESKMFSSYEGSYEELRARFLFPAKEKPKLDKVVETIQASFPHVDVSCIIVTRKSKEGDIPLFGEVVVSGELPELARVALRTTIDLIVVTEAWEAERSLKWTLAGIALKAAKHASELESLK